MIDALRAGQGLTDPAVTVELLRLDAVVGVKGSVNEQGQLTTVGITCALCHSSVDNSFAPGIGRRLDGWANTDLNVGAIVALSPALDDATKAEFRTWGPGKYDPRHHAFDGMRIIPLNSPSLPIVIPPIYGLEGVGFETFTGDGPISYWNSYVGVGQMGGKGTFNDPRIGLFINQTPDLVTPKLAALLAYQLSLHPPKPLRAVSIAKRPSAASVCSAARHVAARAIEARRSRMCSAVPTVACRSCTIRPKSAWTHGTPRDQRRASTGRRLCEGCCSTLRTSTMAALQTYLPWWSTTTRSSG